MKQHTVEKQLQVIESVNLGQLLENHKAMTMTGDKLHDNLVENFNSQKLNSVSSLLSVASYCNASKDMNMLSVGQSIVETIKDSLDARLIYCLETITNPNFRESSLSKQLIEKLEDIIALDTNEAKVSTIRSGTLGVYKTITNLVDWIHEAVAVKQEKITETIYHKAYHPIVFIEEGKNDDFFVKLGNKVFNLKNNIVSETVSPSSKFAYLSSIVEALKFDSVNECLTHVDESIGSFKINENGVFRNDDTLNEDFNHAKFIKDMSFVSESKSSNHGQANRNQQVVDAMLSIHHNYANIAEADNILMIENQRNHEKFAILINENNVYVATISSLRYPNILHKFERIDEAVFFVSEKTGYNASGFFTKAISEQQISDKKSTLIAKKYNTIIEELEQKEIDVKSKITEAKTNLQFNREKALTESLVLIQSTIMEQKQNFSKQFAK